MGDEPLPHEEIRVGEFYLLTVEMEPGTYRLYVGMDGEHYTHYDTGNFSSLREGVEAARNGFNPGRFSLFPYAPFKRERVLRDAPHGIEAVLDDVDAG